jgi:hypothetical protein
MPPSTIITSIPLPRRLRARTPRYTPLIPAPLLQPLLCTQLQLPLQLITGLFPMDKITEAPSDTPLPTIQPATRLPKIRHGTQLTIDRPRRIPPTIQRIARRLRRVLVLEPRVHIADKVIVVVIADDDFFDLAELAHLAPEVLVEGVEVVLQLGRVHFVFLVVGWVLVEVREQDCLRVRGLDVLARAAVTVTAGADLVVEGAVDSVVGESC